jgi:hypothetical protein
VGARALTGFRASTRRVAGDSVDASIDGVAARLHAGGDGAAPDQARAIHDAGAQGLVTAVDAFEVASAERDMHPDHDPHG